jgi:hypothetical protein
MATGGTVRVSNPGRGEIFHTRPDRPWDPPILLYNVSFPGVKRPGRGVNHPPQSNTEVKERVELYLLPLCACMACSTANFTFTFYLCLNTCLNCSILQPSYTHLFSFALTSFIIQKTYPPSLSPLYISTLSLVHVRHRLLYTCGIFLHLPTPLLLPFSFQISNQNHTISFFAFILQTCVWYIVRLPHLFFS